MLGGGAAADAEWVGREEAGAMDKGRAFCPRRAEDGEAAGAAVGSCYYCPPAAVCTQGNESRIQRSISNQSQGKEPIKSGADGNPTGEMSLDFDCSGLFPGRWVVLQ